MYVKKTFDNFFFFFKMLVIVFQFSTIIQNNKVNNNLKLTHFYILKPVWRMKYRTMLRLILLNEKAIGLIKTKRKQIFLIEKIAK